jgi:hypothetical protein
LKADKPQFGQRHEDVEIKLEYHQIIIFPEMTCNFKFYIMKEEDK